MVFTMNPASDGFAGRCATSPALFNRCVVDWFGTWPTKALAQVILFQRDSDPPSVWLIAGLDLVVGGFLSAFMLRLRKICKNVRTTVG